MKRNKKNNFSYITLFILAFLLLCVLFLITSCSAPGQVKMMEGGVGVLEEGLNFEINVQTPTVQGLAISSLTITLVEKIEEPLVVIERPEFNLIKWIGGRVRQLTRIRKYKDGQLVYEETRQTEPVEKKAIEKKSENDNIFFLVLGLYGFGSGYAGIKFLIVVIKYFRNRRRKKNEARNETILQDK